jgi:hypothetical protein
MKSFDDKDLEMVRKHLSTLSEHFDTVQVFVQRTASEGGTMTLHLGTGNWYARYGQVREWIIKREEEARIESRKDEE